MGNCVRKGSDNQSGSDYWESPPASPESFRKSLKKDKEDSGDRFSSSDGKKPTKEVKIKITKKQLEELLGMKEQGLTLEQVLTRLMNGGDGVFQSNQRSWRPALQSIPE